MQIDWWTLGLQALNALVLLWILARFLFKPVADIMKARQEAAEGVLAEAEALKSQAEAGKAAAEAEVARLASERAALMAKAAEEAQATRAALIAAGQADADRIRREAQEAAAALKVKQMAAATAEAGRLTVDLSTKLLDRLPQNARILGFVDGLGEALARLPEESRAGLGADGESLRLKAARALTPDEKAAVDAMLEKTLGHPMPVAVEADPSLIAGLELETPHVLVRNSFRADLERIRAEIDRHE